MARFRSLVLLCVLFSTSCFVTAQSGANDPTFNVEDIGGGFGDGANGQVNVTHVLPDGKILIGGSFTRYNGVAAPLIARLHEDGTLDPGFAMTLDFIAENSSVKDLVVQSDGKIVIVGEFELFLDSTHRANTARLNSNGTLDVGFAEVGLWAINSIAQQSDGRLILGMGLPAHLGGVKVARLNVDGTQDLSFFQPLSAINGVFTVMVLPDDRILIGGSFVFPGSDYRAKIARLDPDGHFDPSFAPSITVPVHPLGVQAIAVQSDGSIIIGGNITSINGVLVPNIARLDSEGNVEMGFGGGLNVSTVHSIAIQADDRIIVGGAFQGLYNHIGVRRLNPDGTIEAGFPAGFAAGPAGYTPSIVLHVELQLDGKIVLGGAFQYCGIYHQPNCARLGSDGSFDQSFNAGTAMDDGIEVMVIQPDDKIIAGGSFNLVNSMSRHRLARMTLDGSLDTSFAANVDEKVTACLLQPDGKVIIGGDFTNVNNIPRNSLARLNTDGSLDVDFDPDSIGPEGRTLFEIYAVALQPDDKVLVSGRFNFTGSFQYFYQIVRLNSDGSLDTDYTLSGDFGGNVRGLLLQPDGKILTYHLGILSSNYTEARIMRFNQDGSQDSLFNNNSQIDFNGVSTGTKNPLSMALQPDGKIILGGSFVAVDSVLRPGIARLLPNGELDLSFEPVIGGRSVLIQPDGQILVGDSTISRLNEDGSLDASFVGEETSFEDGPTTRPPLRLTSIAQQSNGKIIIGGYFTRYGTTGRNRIARLLNDFTTTVPYAETQTVSTFPNPTTGTFNLTSNFTGVVAITVTDLTGQVVEKKQTQWPRLSPYTVDLEGYSPGVYLVTLQGGDRTSTTRVVLQ